MGVEKLEIEISQKNNSIQSFKKKFNYNKELDGLLILIILISYIFFTLINKNRDFYLDLMNYVSLSLAVCKFIFLIRYNDIVFYSIRMIGIILANNIFLRNHNPFFNSLFFYLPMQDFFRVILMFKFCNYFFEMEINNLDNQEQLILTNNKYLNCLNYQTFGIFIDIFKRIKNKKKFLLSVILLFFSLKCVNFFIQDNYLPKSFQNSIRQKKYFICANLFNNEKILDDWTSEMLKLVDYLGKENVYISILENGDSTDGTISKLNDFQSILNDSQIKNKIISSKIYHKQTMTRIPFLVELRNRVIEPMISEIDWMFDEFLIIYFNDIIYKWQDIVKLIMTNNMNYDITCGLDFYFVFYDKWVSRDLDGRQVRNYFPYFIDKTAQEQVLNEEPVRVFSCWNGVAVLNPEPFKDYHNFKFRANNSIMQSECFLLCYDYWVQGFNRVLINPNLKFTYDYFYYYTIKYGEPFLKIPSYFYYYFNFWFENNLSSANLDDRNIELKKNWRMFI
jgi:hypothetical protein